MKVLIFSKQALWQGGVVNFIETLKKNLSKDISAEQFLMGNRKSGPRLLGKIFWPFYDAFRLVFIVLLKRYDVYHINPSLNAQSLFRDGLFLVIVRLLSSSRIVVSFHGWENSTEKAIENSYLLRTLFRWVFTKADCILVLARPFKEWLITNGIKQDRVHLFTTMFDGTVLKDVRSSTDPDTLNLLFLSRFVREKGIYELLEAFKKLCTKYEDVYLHFAGAGGEEAEMQAWVAENNLESRVKFWGYVRDSDKAEVFKSADIFVFPTYYGEGCPVSLLEAMAAGLGVITTPVGGIPDIITSEQSGILINQKVYIDQLYDAISRLVTNPDYLNEMKKYNFTTAWERYDAPTVTKKFEEFYHD